MKHFMPKKIFVIETTSPGLGNKTEHSILKKTLLCIEEIVFIVIVASAQRHPETPLLRLVKLSPQYQPGCIASSLSSQVLTSHAL